MLTAYALLRINEKRTIEIIYDYLQQLSTRYLVKGILAGLSGGLDPAVLLALARHAFTKNFVHAMYLFDQDSEHGEGNKALLVADWLGIELESQSIERGKAGRCFCSNWKMRIARLSPSINRALYRLYNLLSGESPFVTSLRAGADQSGHKARSLNLKLVHRLSRDIFYSRHIYRREIMETKANLENWLLLGAANSSELETGWFVQGGVDDLPFQPLIGLYKTQVFQLGHYLGLPDSILRQRPSPDMMRGVNDEYALGMHYSKIDIILDHLAGGISKGQLLAAGISEDELQQIKKINQLYIWKRRKMNEPWPVNDGPDGEIRLGTNIEDRS